MDAGRAHHAHPAASGHAGAVPARQVGLGAHAASTFRGTRAGSLRCWPCAAEKGVPGLGKLPRSGVPKVAGSFDQGGGTETGEVPLAGTIPLGDTSSRSLL